MRVVIKKELLTGLQDLGLRSGDTVIVHTSLKSFGYVCGGAQSIIEALLETVGDAGTVMMPAQSWKNLDPETGVHWDADKSQWQLIRDYWPAYDKQLTPTNTMGAVAEMFRLWPGSIRSDHPARSFCAWGKHAVHLVKDHDLEDIFGETSPLAKLYSLNGKVLMLGTGYDKNTSIHLADVRAEYPGKHKSTEHSAVLENGRRVWKAYDTLAVDGEDFEEIGSAFENCCDVKETLIGDARCRLMNQRELVDFSVKWIERNRR